MFIYSVVGFICCVFFELKLNFLVFVKKKVKSKTKNNLFAASQIMYIPTHPYKKSHVRQYEHRLEHVLKLCVQ